MVSGLCRRLRLAAILVPLALAAIAQAAVINVDANCTFEDALYAADRDEASGGCPAGSGDDTIVLKTNVTLTRVLEQVDSKITIRGGGYTIDGGGEFAFINNQPGGEVIISDLTLTNAWTDNDSWVIQNYGKMTVADSAFIDNGKARHGIGGVFTYGATISDGFLTISNTTIRTTAESVRALNVNSNATGSVTLSHATVYTPNYVGLYVTGDGRKIVRARNSVFAGDFYAQCWIPKLPSEPQEPSGSDLLAEFVGNVVANATPATKNLDSLCKNRVRSAGLGSLTGSPAYFPLELSSPARGIGVSSVCAAFPRDQAGKGRPAIGCDAGAVQAIMPKKRDAAPKATPTLKPPYSSCEQFNDAIIVRRWNLGAQCQRVDGGGIGNEQIVSEGFIMAVDIWGWLGAGVDVCFAASGKIVLLDAATSPRRILPLPAFAENGRTCVTLERPGTVVLQPGDAPLAKPTAAAESRWVATLSNCMVRTQASLRFRESPGGRALGGVPNNAMLTALERSAEWFLVDYYGRRGWISAHYVTPEGDCA